MTSKRIFFSFAFIFCILFAATAQTKKSGSSVSPAPAKPDNIPVFFKTNQLWVDSVFATLSPDERIGQLIMVAAYSNRNKKFEDSIANVIARHKVGGLVFFQGGPVRQAKLTNRYQSISKVPLLIAMDAEWGLGMRLDSTVKFPYQMSMGGIQNEKLIYDMGAEVARQFKRIGMHINFAPVIDVNNNADNPVINFRSFGENKHNVARKGAAYMKGMQDKGIMACAKHFPGHGDTDVDSHYSLPKIYYNRKRLDTLEMYPFKELMRQGLGSVMVAHLNIPALDTTTNLPSTLSKPIVTDLLKNELGFKGLVISDAMNMKGVTNNFPDGTADVKAILAGNDIIEFSENVERAITLIREAIAKNQITQEEIDQRVKKILAAKYWAGLHKFKPVALKNLYADLNNPMANFINRKLTEMSVTVLRNNRNTLPVNNLDTLRIAALAIGVKTATPFQQMLNRYAPTDNFFLPANASIDYLRDLKNKLQKYNLIIAGVHDLSARPASNYGVSAETVVFVKELAKGKKTILSIFGNAYSSAKFQDLDKLNAVIMAYQESVNAQEVAAEIIFGGLGAKGRLPVTTSPAYKASMGIATTGGTHFKYSSPEDIGLSSKTFSRIDSLVQIAIREKAIPGAQVLVAKGGNVIYQKSFGYHTYENKVPVNNSDIYDLASVTKISTSIAALMKLQDEGKFDFNKTVGDYLPEFRGSSKENLVFKEILAHQARLQAWIPFWQVTKKKNGKFKWYTFKADSSARFPTKVAQNLYMHRNYHNKIYKQIKESPLNEKAGYVYSDLSFYLYPVIVERLTGKKFEEYLKENFYKPLGAQTLTFTPEKYFPHSRIVPTEYDSLFRKQLLHGTVHDEGAAMLGGVSGHAGLFGNANDLAKLMQMYLQKGEVAGRRYISEATLNTYTSCQFCPTNRRALGFDRINSPYVENGNAAKGASPESFGHSGFTGTFTWVDPKYDLVYVFLSNRVHPTRNNNKLSQLNTRTAVQQVIYDAIEEAAKTQARRQ
ncbi:glycoside hydrolase family 3 N-terminal domain-containing protein [Adhaeribacter rhizoryzae]|uniref:beta-N-acetylhexosaminidase n=1 Tax=Adhaeribacter rhizoryzae TaxID=2607907 RepID=A0A5M6CVM7_9BACT|nr:glycoside hydrolase family 3 N-terminal domain-containing protein [Adhaeribacter rhizoryzae]KAA5539271.1 serine hydrolase [Adhaeribacter rhizoryzae]